MKHADDPSELRAEAERLGVWVSTEQATRLQLFETLILQHAVPWGMVGDVDPSRIRSRHILDSLRAAATVDEADGFAYDLGSGAGLPGVVIAVARPTLSVGLVEARARRAAFLELAVERLGLANARVLRQRVEDLGEPADLCFARALAALPRAWQLAEPLLRPGGRLVYFAGDGARIPDRIAGRIPRVLRAPVLERGGPLVIMAR